MAESMTAIAVSLLAIFGVALALVIVVAMRALRHREGSPRTRLRSQAARRRAHAAGQPNLFVDAARRQDDHVVTTG